MGTRRLELGPESYAWINPKGKWKPSGHLKQGDMVMLCHTARGFELSQQPAVQGVLMAFDLEKGGILAMVGGLDYSQSQFNRAISARRQSGSAIKPFIYAAALDKGMTPATVIFDAPVTYRAGADEETWQPKNYENRFYGATSLRTGLVLSRNVVTIKILSDIGMDYAISYLNHFDMKARLPRNLSLALGSGDVSPLNLFKGYAVFAVYGLKFEPHLIESVVQSGRGTIFRPPPPSWNRSSRTTRRPCRKRGSSRRRRPSSLPTYSRRSSRQGRAGGPRHSRGLLRERPAPAMTAGIPGSWDIRLTCCVASGSGMTT
jgi:penicillin-binding protein 1A